MVKYILTLAVLLSNSCSHIERGILFERAEYDDENTVELSKQNGNINFFERKEIGNNQTENNVEVSRTSGKVKKAWLHGHELPSGDYFGGAWVYLITEKTQWKIEEKK